MNNNLYSLNLEGVGSNSGGEFDSINISGVYQMNGDLICNRFDVSGVLKSSGNIYSKELKASGVIKCKESLESKEINLQGLITIEKHIKSENIFGEGCIEGKEGIESEKIDINGKVDCNGLINCEDFIMLLQGESNIDEIGASNIDIQGEYSSKNIFKIFVPKKYKNNKAYIKIIEGDNIRLSDCNVDIVRGKNITIGKNCNIDTIEYSENIDTSELSKVKDIKKI